MSSPEPTLRPTRLFVIAAVFVALGLLAGQVLPAPANDIVGLVLCIPAVVFAALFIVALVRRRGLD